MTKIDKNLQLKEEKNLYQKLLFTYHSASIKDIKSTGEAFNPHKRTSSASKHEISELTHKKENMGTSKQCGTVP
jgi:hypothetical protein